MAASARNRSSRVPSAAVDRSDAAQGHHGGLVRQFLRHAVACHWRIVRQPVGDVLHAVRPVNPAWAVAPAAQRGHAIERALDFAHCGTVVLQARIQNAGSLATKARALSRSNTAPKVPTGSQASRRHHRTSTLSQPSSGNNVLQLRWKPEVQVLSEYSSLVELFIKQSALPNELLPTPSSTQFKELIIHKNAGFCRQGASHHHHPRVEILDQKSDIFRLTPYENEHCFDFDV